jgi:hypothetical protein
MLQLPGSAWDVNVRLSRSSFHVRLHQVIRGTAGGTRQARCPGLRATRVLGRRSYPSARASAKTGTNVSGRMVACDPGPHRAWAGRPAAQRHQRVTASPSSRPELTQRPQGRKTRAERHPPRSSAATTLEHGTTRSTSSNFSSIAAGSADAYTRARMSSVPSAIVGPSARIAGHQVSVRYKRCALCPGSSQL